MIRVLLSLVLAFLASVFSPSVPIVTMAVSSGNLSVSSGRLPFSSGSAPTASPLDFVASLSPDTMASPPPEGLRLLFWNLENFFDFRNDSTSVSDAEFSAGGERHWTRKRFYAKCNAVAKTLLWAGTPDVAAFAEVENAFVLRRLLTATPLYKTDYRPVHYDSPDPRGIDVALLYRADKLKLLESKPLRVYRPDAPDSLLRTRDILLARFRQRASGAEFFLLVCHLPSKYGGAEASAPKRAAAVRRLRSITDSLAAGPLHALTDPLAVGQHHALPDWLAAGSLCALADSLAAGSLQPEMPVRFLPVPLILCGDFNDTPDSPVFQPLEAIMTNLATPLAADGQGTLRYAGQWDLIDQFWIFPAPPLPALPGIRMTILRPPFLLTRDTAHGGLKPLRTYSGPRYLGGVSDHLPILLLVPP